MAGCDTRDRILARDLTRKTYVAGEDCRIQSGILRDPYTAETIMYVRGGASEVDIDHVVALGDAWQKGAQQWSQGRREMFANDPLELLAVSSTANRAKGDGDAATWLPSNKSFRCDYVARQIAVKQKYGLWVTPAEHDAMARVLSRCPGQKLPKSSLQPPSVASTQPAIPVRQSRRGHPPRPPTRTPVKVTSSPTAPPSGRQASPRYGPVPRTIAQTSDSTGTRTVSRVSSPPQPAPSELLTPTALGREPALWSDSRLLVKEKTVVLNGSPRKQFCRGIRGLTGRTAFALRPALLR